MANTRYFWAPVAEEGGEKGYYSTVKGDYSDIEKVDPSIFTGYDINALQRGVGAALPLSSLTKAVTTPTNPVGSTDALRTNVSNLQTNINGLENTDFNTQMQGILNQITNPQPVNDAGLTQLNELRAGIDRPFNEDELRRIEEAGKLAGSRFDPLIQKAEEEKRRGLPKALITAGERGGFMNTQFAGRAALQSTQGGDFIGAGGELENIKSAYDLNISQVQGAKNAAISQARNAMEEFIRGGRMENYRMAVDSYKLAQQASERQSQINQEKLDAILKWKKVQDEMNKPILQANQAIQDFALESMQKYTSGFSDLDPASLSQLTLADIQKRILASNEYKMELEKGESYYDTTRGYTTDMKEYEFAKEQGYTGTFQQWQDRNRKRTGDTTPTSGVTFDQWLFKNYGIHADVLAGNDNEPLFKEEYAKETGTSFDSLKDITSYLSNLKVQGYTMDEAKQELGNRGMNVDIYSKELNSVYGKEEEDNTDIPPWLSNG